MELVSIKEALDILEHNAPKNPRRQWGVMVRMATNTVAKALAERKTGKWIDHSEDGYVECPLCGYLTTCEGNKEDLHYCFWCGAKMEADE